MSAENVSLTIDGEACSVPAGTTIWDAARAIGIDIPALCHDPRLHPVGVCRVCVVDIGQRTLAAACVRPCEADMAVRTDTAEVHRHRRTLVELLLSEQPATSRREATTADDALYALARDCEVDAVPYADGAEGAPRPVDDSSPVIAVDHQACILCDRCIRACDDIQHNDVITRSGKGYGTRIAFDLDVPMGESTCVSCGECVATCPTGALTNAGLPALLPRGSGGSP